ncbi:MAG: DUF4743 domain-containing protein [Rhodospirillales bacterium CG15_BIG_FIL_POST_REV_8_21_14_020_66_15]|nr:MAG: DUF4743 domain-containing protein [Rhodospirillales bacterium CG15_BIG_FIL_POST_REV_8_21_14_020_66_15]
MSYLDRIRALQAWDAAAYRPFTAGGRQVGLIHRDFAPHLADFAGTLRVTEDAVALDPALTEPASRTAAMAEVLSDLRGRGLIRGWRDEPYAVRERWGAPVLFRMERAAVPLFGVEGCGVHVNGFVRDGDGMKMWIGKRALDKPTAPGKLDQIVAGGLPAGIGVMENLVKECGEEAAIPEAVARTARPVGAISYCTERAEGLRRDVLFNYDLELPGDFEPRNTDGEIAGFHLWPMERVMDVVRESDDFKFNCGAIVIDFLIRRGFIGPDHSDYVEIQRGLHRARA